MASPASHDPYASFNYVLELDGSPVAAFAEVSGLSAEIAVIEYRDGNDKVSTPRKIPGLAKYANVVLKRGITKDLGLWQWMRQALQGNVSRKNGTIVLLDETRQPVLRFKFVRGWPCKWVGPSLNAASNDIAIETLEIAHEGLDVE